jgi:MFS family permease
MAALTLAAVFSRPVAGWALDKYGRKLIYLGGLLVFLVPSILYIFMVPVTLLIVLRFIQGLGWGVANTSSWTVASDIVPPERLGEGMGFFSATLSISMAVAPAVALWLIAQYSFEALFLACSLLT